MSSQNATIRFPAMGDWGGIERLNGYFPTQDWNAELMNDLCANNACDMLVSLGDNFYYHGVKTGFPIISLKHLDEISQKLQLRFFETV